MVQLLTLHFARGSVQSPDEFSLIKLVVAGDEGSGGDDLVSHLLQSVEHVECGRGELHSAVLLVPPLRGGGGLLCQDTELVQGQAIHRAAEKKRKINQKIGKMSISCPVQICGLEPTILRFLAFYPTSHCHNAIVIKIELIRRCIASGVLREL